MSLENLLAQGGEQNLLPESLTTSTKDSNDNGIFRDHGLTTKEKEELLSKKIDADKEPLDKEGQELRRRIDKDIVNSNFEDISKILATANSQQLEKVLQKVCRDFAGESEIRSYPSILKDKDGQTSLFIRFGTPPWACYFGEHAVEITAKGVEFHMVGPIRQLPRWPEPGSVEPSPPKETDYWKRP